jgi:uncharacterized GH25 family protein
MRFRFGLFAVGVAALLLPACGGPNMAKVTGKVTCNGKPVKEAAVTFSPLGASEDDKEPGKPATGFTDNDGNYELSTYKPLDGAQVGKHTVLIMIDDTNPAKCKREKRTTAEVKKGTNEVNFELAD